MGRGMGGREEENELTKRHNYALKTTDCMGPVICRFLQVKVKTSYISMSQNVIPHLSREGYQ